MKILITFYYIITVADAAVNDFNIPNIILT